MKNFALIGVSGYIAPRHLKAIKHTGNNLIGALDRFDSVGIIDNFFPNADFFVEPERFDRYIEKLKYEKDIYLDFVSICTPNYLHDAHIRMALRWGADAICEKPLVLNPWNIDALSNMEEKTGQKVYNVLQLRYHKSILDLKKKIDLSNKNKIFDVDLTYITSRGKWYSSSWKGNDSKSGGIATNIGVHFYDMLSWIFGDLQENIVHFKDDFTSAGYLQFKKARVRWFLSINSNELPSHIQLKNQKTFRSITIQGEELEFSDGFTELHNLVYKDILLGNGFGLEDTRQAINIVYDIRNSKPIGLKGDYHPYLKDKDFI